MNGGFRGHLGAALFLIAGSSWSVEQRRDSISMHTTKATADTQIFTEGSMSSIRCGHHLALSIALDSPRRVAGRTRHAVAFMCNVLSVQLNRGRGGLHGSVSSRLVAV
jgi:hypothetical protein